MNSNIYISYIVPCFNIQEYLPRCLESLSRQRIEGGKEIEYILVNDGSPDKCLEILREFAEKDNRAVVIDQQNQGVSAARNAGLRVATGQYVFFLDGDDFLTDDASQYIYDASKEKSPGIIVSNAYFVKDGEWNAKEEWNPCENMTDGTYPVYYFVESITTLPISFKTYSRALLINNNIIYDEDLKVGEVYTFFLHALSCAQSIAVSNKRVMYYVKRDNSVMRDGNIKRDESILNTIIKIDQYAQYYSFDIRMLYSYNAAFLRIVNAFTQNKYVRQSKYTKEIGNILENITKMDAYKNVLKYFIFSCPRFNKNTFYGIGMLVLNKRFFYTILKLLISFKEKQINN